MTGFVVLFLAALAAADSGGARDLSDRVFPPGTSTIFAVEVVEASPSAWRTLPSGLQERTIGVRLKIEQPLLGAEARKTQSSLSVAAEIRQNRWNAHVVWDAPGFWSYRDPLVGGRYLVFSSVTSSAGEAFAQPLGVWELSEEPNLLQDVELVLAGKALGEAAQESQILGVTASSGTHSIFFARYAAAVASLSKTANRKTLLAWIGRVGDGTLSERAKAELLRSFHSALTEAQKPPADALNALTAACLKTLAALGPEELKVTPRLESVAQVYLPWLARAGANLKSEAREMLTPQERARAASTAAQLGSLDLPEASKKVLRELADALK